MKINKNDIIKIPSNIPENTSLIHSNPDYVSWQSAKIPKHINAQQAYIKITANQPKWLNALFKVRDLIAKRIGIRAVLGFSESEEEGGNITGKMHFFDIIENTNNKLTLKVEDTHLDVCLCIVIVENELSNKTNDLYLTTSVKNKNIFGRVYMMPVSLLHPIIAKKLLSNIKKK